MDVVWLNRFETGLSASVNGAYHIEYPQVAYVPLYFYAISES